jgi:hypothetical protein
VGKQTSPVTSPVYPHRQSRESVTHGGDAGGVRSEDPGEEGCGALVARVGDDVARRS